MSRQIVHFRRREAGSTGGTWVPTSPTPNPELQGSGSSAEGLWWKQVLREFGEESMAAATLQLPTWTEAVLSAAREAATNASLVIEDVSGALTSSPEGEVYEIVVVTPSTTDTRHMLDAEQAIRESVFQQFPQDISIRVTRLT